MVTTGSAFESVTTYTCLPGYRSTSGDLERVCSIHSNWTGGDAVCEPIPGVVGAVTCLGATLNITCNPVNDTEPMVDILDASFGVTSLGLCGATSIEECPSNKSDLAIVRQECQAEASCSLNPTHEMFGHPCSVNITSDPFLTILYVCREFICADPGMVANSGRVVENSFKAYSTVTYTCISGYELASGNITRECQSTEQWSGSPPSCTAVDCGHPGEVDNALRTGNTTVYPANMTYECDAGWRKVLGSEIRYCQPDKSWSGTKLMCTRVTCPTPNEVEHAFIVDNGYLYEDMVNYTCGPGYELTNTNSSVYTRVCQANKAWSGVTPTCSRKNCGPPTIYNHTFVEGSSHLFGDVITYRCYFPYVMLSENEFVHNNCSEEGTWSGFTPVCNLGGCGDPGTAAHSTRKVNSYNTMENVTYTCRKGYEWQGQGHLKRQCLKTGWTGSLPVCEKKCCPEPAQVAQAKRYGSSFCYQDAVVYACNLGFEITEGEQKITCTENRTWSGAAPVCDRSLCGNPGTASEGVGMTGDQYKVDDVIKFDCIPGFFYLGGDHNRTCRADKTWSGIPMKCRRKSCGEPAPIPRTRRFGNSFMFEDMLLYSCFTGYNLTNGTLAKLCIHNGTWSGEDPFCEAIPGPPPNQRKAAWKSAPKSEASGSTYVGGIAIGLVVGTLGTMILLDLITIQMHLEKLKRNLKAGWKRYSAWKDSRVHNKVSPECNKGKVRQIKVKP